MSLTHLNSDTLRPLVKLIGRKEFLFAELAKIDSQVSSILSCKPLPSGKRVGRPSKKTPVAKVTVAKPAKNRGGGLKGKILSALKAAEDEGVKVVDLAKKLKVKGTSLHVSFGTTGKKNPAIKKVGKGHYKLVGK